MTSPPTSVIDTPAGRLLLRSLRGGHLHISTLSTAARQAPTWTTHPEAHTVAETIRIHGRPHTLSIKLYQADRATPSGPATRLAGGWVLDHAMIALRRANQPSETPRTPAARAWVVATIVPAIVAWASSQVGWELLASIRRDDLTTRIYRLTLEINQRQTERDQLQTELATLAQQER